MLSLSVKRIAPPAAMLNVRSLTRLWTSKGEVASTPYERNCGTVTSKP